MADVELSSPITNLLEVFSFMDGRNIDLGSPITSLVEINSLEYADVYAENPSDRIYEG